jgi:hypothetical protein
VTWEDINKKHLIECETPALYDPRFTFVVLLSQSRPAAHTRRLPDHKGI